MSESKKTNIGHLLSMLMKDYHYVIVDLPASLENAVYEALEQSDLIHIVTDSEKESLSSTRAFIAGLKNSIKDISDNVFVVVNETEAEKVNFFGRKRKKVPGEKIYASLPAFDDLQKNKNCFMAVLECPDTKYAKAVRSIAREIGEVLVGLALSGGSAFGFAHIGVLKVFEEEGIDIDVVAGTSIGALVGGLWCCELSATELEKIALRFRNKFRTLRLFDFTFPRRGLTAGKHVVKLLEKYIKGKTFEDTRVPLKVTACDLESRQEVVFEEGSIVKAIRASISIPGVFEPLEHKGKFLIDGGVLQPAPIAPLIRLGVSKIIAVNVLPSQLDLKKSYQKYIDEQKQQDLIIKKSDIFKKISYRFKKRIRRLFFPNIFDAIVIAMQATESILAEISCKQADVCLHPDLSGVSWFEFYRAKELIKKGQEEARRCLPQIKAVLGSTNKP
jgi:predicted acylesterase/phospholipase RssA